jgi:hypothetical protein
MQSQRLTWRTLWASVREIYYGPPGYLGPPLLQLPRQAWLRQPGLVQVVFHSNIDILIDPGNTASLFYLNGFNFIIFDDSKDIYGEYIGVVDEIPWYYTGFSSSQAQYQFFSLPLMHMGAYLLEESSLRVIREEKHAGRRAVVLEGVFTSKTRRVRLWVDALTGVVLRRLDYSAISPGVVLREAGVEAIEFDAEFPAGIFNPGERVIRDFVQDPSGAPAPVGQDLFASPRWSETRHIRLAPVPAPPGLDPSHLPVFLQWPESWEQAAKTPTPGSPRGTASGEAGEAATTGTAAPEPERTASPGGAPGIQVFAGQYLLGSLPLESVNFGGCRRSPDGRLIALRAGHVLERDPNRLYWFSLEAPQALHEICRGCDELPFAFSPDSQNLAYTGCRELSSPPGCAIFVRNLPTNNLSSWQISNDISESYPFFLAWSPEGRSLAILALVEGWTQTRLKILDLQSGEFTYSGDYDPASGTVAPDSPTLKWGLTFPPYDEIELGCMAPSE